MLVQEAVTELSPAEVIRFAREFFATRFTPYGAFAESEGEDHLTLQLDAGELVIGAGVDENGQTVVRGSTSRLHHELSQFLVSVADTAQVRQNTLGPGTSGAG